MHVVKKYLGSFLISIIITAVVLWSAVFLLPIFAQMDTNTNGSVVNILNLYNGQELTENYILDFEAIDNTEHLQLIFVDANGVKDSREAYAYQSSSSLNIWHYNLEIAELGDGNYRLETSVIFSDSTIMVGDIREFSINENPNLFLEVFITNPKEGDIISENYLFTAETNQVVDSLYFNIYTGTGVLMVQEEGVETNSDHSYHADYNTNNLTDGEYIVRANATLENNTVDSRDINFYINNQVDSTSTSTDTTTADGSEIDNSDSNDDNLSEEVKIEFTSPSNNSAIQETVLFQAKTNRLVDNVYFRIDSNYISAKKFDDNRWQEYVDTAVYENGLVEVIAVATNEGIDYYDTLKLNIQNEISTDNAEIESQVGDNDKDKSDASKVEPDCIQEIYYARSSSVSVCQKFTDSCSVPPGWESCELNNESRDQDSQKDQEDSTSNFDNDVKNENEEGPYKDDDRATSDQIIGICDDLGVQDVDCRKYLMNINDYPRECVADKFDLAVCETKYQECRSLEIANIDLCFKYLSEPRQSRWCDLPEFNDLKVCQSYINKKYEEKQLLLGSNITNDFSKECLDQNIIDKKKCEKFLYYLRLPIECRKNKIYNRQECENLLKDDYLNKVCQQMGVSDITECQNKLVQSYKDKFICDSGDCARIVKEKLVNELAVKDIINKGVKESLKEYNNKPFYSNRTAVTKQQADIIGKMPIVYELGLQYKILSAEEKIKITEYKLEAPLPAVLAKDSDGDGVPDDVEERLGTDKYDSDSDKDGYLDGIELENGYDPLSPSKKLDKQLAPIELALIKNKVLEHPLVSGDVSEDLQIKSFKNISTTDEGLETSKIALSGTGPAFSVLSLFIYSDLPMVATMQVDEFGRWEYTMTDSLVDGEHQVFVVLNDDNGKIVKKSAGSLLFVKEAKAASVDEVIDFSFKEDSKSLVSYYYYGVVIAIVLGLLLFFILRKSLKKGDLTEL